MQSRSVLRVKVRLCRGLTSKGRVPLEPFCGSFGASSATQGLRCTSVLSWPLTWTSAHLESKLLRSLRHSGARIGSPIHCVRTVEGIASFPPSKMHTMKSGSSKTIGVSSIGSALNFGNILPMRPDPAFQSCQGRGFDTRSGPALHYSALNLELLSKCLAPVIPNRITIGCEYIFTNPYASKSMFPTVIKVYP